MKWLHEFLGKFIFKEPRAYIWGAKSLLLSFPDEKNAFPSIHILNLNDCRKIDFSIKEDRIDEEKMFILIANVYEIGEDIPSTLTLGKFETRVEAASALLQLKSKLYGPALLLLKMLFFVLILFFLLSVMIDSGKNWFANRSVATTQAEYVNPQYNSRSLPTLQQPIKSAPTMPAPTPQIQPVFPAEAPVFEFKEGSSMNDALKQGLSK